MGLLPDTRKTIENMKEAILISIRRRDFETAFKIVNTIDEMTRLECNTVQEE